MASFINPNGSGCACARTECSDECGVFRKYKPKTKPITHGDELRAMSDDELAAFFAQQKYRKPVFDGWLPLCYHVMGPRTCPGDGCEKCWLDWLKQEVSE